MRWPAYEHLFFDCDSTLTTVEGIDVLAQVADKKYEVEQLTKAAMEGHVGLEEVYAKRLAAITPTQKQIQAVRQAYKNTIVEDAQALIQALQFLGHKLYIISGGLYEPVAEFGVYLGIPRENIRAVKVEYNPFSGEWWRNDHYEDSHYLTFQEGPLTISDGKAQIVQELLGKQIGRSLLIGDGSSDLLASHAVDLFVGYGGVEKRKPVLEKAPAFLHSPSIAPLLILAHGFSAVRQLQNTPHQELAEKAAHLIEEGAITFTHEQLSTKFHQARQAFYSRPS